MFLGINSTVLAQLSARNNSVWMVYSGDNKINSKIGIYSELQARNYFRSQTYHQSLLRLGLSGYISSNTMLTFGYAYIHSTPSNDLEGNDSFEHRIWQQLLLRYKSKLFFTQHRYRLEQRFMHNKTTNTFNYMDRIRYNVQLLFPFYLINPVLRHWFVSGANEVFVNFPKKNASQYFDRNRFSFSLGYMVSPELNFRLSYLHQLANITTQIEPEIHHVIQVSLSYNLDDLTGTIMKKR